MAQAQSVDARNSSNLQNNKLVTAKRMKRMGYLSRTQMLTGSKCCPTGDGHTAQRDLRGGLPRLLVRFPARTQRAPRDGCARGWNREQEGELDTGRRYPIIL